MTFFNLKRLARLLAILLAILPISELSAASPSVSVSTADTIISAASNSADATTILSAAGFPGALQAALTGAGVSQSSSTAQTFTSTLTYLFGVSMKKYGSSSNLNYSAIQSLYQTYNTQAQSVLLAISKKQAPTVAAVSNAMQSLVVLIAASLNSFGYEFMKNATALALPLTGQTIEPNGSVPSKDQYVVNLFVQELSAWIQYYVSAATGNANSSTSNSLQTAAVQLGLTSQTAAAMQDVINAATNDSSALYGPAGTACSNNTTIQSQINCAIAWYQAQLNIIVSNTNNGVIRNIAPSIDPTTSSIFTITTPSASAALALNTPATSSAPVTSSIDAATANLKEIDTTATATIKGYVATYGPKITAATDSATVNSVFSTALGLINAAYPALSATSGTIAAQNNAVSNLESAVNSAVAALTKLPSTPFNIAHTAYTTAQTNFSNAYTAATTDFPVDLPVSNGVGTLTATTASAYGASVPGAQVEALATDQTNALNAITTTSNNNNNATVASVTANTAALNSAVTAAEQLFTSYTSAPATITLVGTATGLASAIAQVNTYYTQTIAAGSAYITALANANALLTQLNGMQSVTPQPTGLASAISTMQTAISAANTAFPQASSAITFTVANSAAGQTYATSVPGIAVTALNAITTTNNNNNATVASVTANTAALNGAVTTAQSTFTTYTSSPATITLVGTATGLASAIAQVNTDYTQTIAAGSAYTTALANANTLLKQLSSLQSQNPQPTGLASAISTMQTAINAANNAFPQSIPAITFTVANSAAGQAYANTVPGTAITALNTAASKSGGSSRLSRADLAGIIIAAIMASVLGAAGYKIWKNKQASNSDPKTEAAEDAIAESSASDDELSTTSELDPTDPDFNETVDSFMKSTDLVAEVQPAITSAVEVATGLTPGSLEANGLVNTTTDTPVQDAATVNETLVETVAAGADVQAAVDAAGNIASARGTPGMQELDSLRTSYQEGVYNETTSASEIEAVEGVAQTNALTTPEVKGYTQILNDVIGGTPGMTAADALEQVDAITEKVSGNGFKLDDLLDLLGDPNVTYSSSAVTNLQKMQSLVETITNNNIQRGTGTIDSLVSTINNPESGPTGPGSGKGGGGNEPGNDTYEELVQTAKINQQAEDVEIKSQGAEAISNLRTSIVQQMEAAEPDSEEAAAAEGKAQAFNEDFPEDPIE